MISANGGLPGHRCTPQVTQRWPRGSEPASLEKEEFDSAISQWGTEGLNRDGTLKHSYPDDKWVLVPVGYWNWKWNQARGNYSTYEQELLAGMLVLSSQARLLGSNPVVWLCDQEPVRTFQKGPPPEKAELRRWWTG